MTNIWYNLESPTVPTSFGKSVGSECEAAFAASIPNEFDHELYVIEWANGIPSLVRKQQSVIDAERAVKELAAWRETADCSRLQAMLVLEEDGLLEQIEAWIDSRSVPKAAKLAWKEAYRFSRKSPLWGQFAQLFGLSEEQIDDLFRRAMLKEV